MAQLLHPQSPSNFKFTPHEMDDRSRSIFQNIPSQKPHDMQKKIVPLEEVWKIDMSHEDIMNDPAEASLERLVVLLNWTLLSAVVYMVLNSSYLCGAAFRASFDDASTRKLLLKLAQVANGPILDHSFSAQSIHTSLPQYTLYRGFVYTSILLGFVVAFLIILGKSFMGRYTLDLTMSSRRNPRRLYKSRRQSLPMPTCLRLTLESLPTVLPLAQAVFTMAIFVTYHFAL
ncbi:hypothetical protein AZE42_04015 [Rhizopogon vesiculosus]|uniref:DUF6535 domain-containing protein n=1 Tax=Rhizopogon vesiculosus TaxID=180088 RepID=A0A1J8R9X8_9AGAM|nr:hypothetical protein AZE42_04015 [Rhizopogon vesiculosus]